MSLLGLDVGTTGCKAVVFSEEGRLLAAARRSYALHNPRPGFWELDPEDLLSRLFDCLREATAGLADPVTCLAVSALGEAVVPVDSAGRPLAAAVISSDMRGRDDILQLVERIDESRITAITGQPATPYYALAKMMWWRRVMPDLHGATSRYLAVSDLVLARLGLPAVTEPSMAGRTLAYELASGGWSADILEAAGIDIAKMPEVVASGSVVGRLGRQGADLTGLDPAVTVVTGGFDQACAALGAAVTDTGSGFHGLGTTEALAIVIDGPDAGLSALHLALGPHVLPGRLLAMGGSQTGGRLLRWLRDEFCAEDRQAAGDRDVYDVMLAGLTPEPGPLMILPHFAGSGTLDNDPLARGAVLGLSFDSRRQDVVKAALEGITYEQARLLSAIRRAGSVVDRLTVVGGGARSDLWMQIKADILDCRLTRLTLDDASCRGAALLAGLATGIYPDVASAIAAGAPPSTEFLPEPGRRDRHAKRLMAYAGLHDRLADMHAVLRETA